MDNFLEIMRKLSDIKQKMLEKNLTACRAKCPKCGEKGKLHVVLAGRRNHMHTRCTAEGCTFFSME